MKAKKLHFIVATILAAIVFIQDATAQLGMDYDVTNGTFFRYSRLRKVGGTVFMQNRFNEKAIGVYPGPLTGINPLPASALEVNTNFTHFPAFLSTWYSRGEVFRTDCPSAVTSNWRMLRGGFEVGRLFNNSGSNDFNLQASEGNLIFQAPNGKVIVQDELVLKAAGTEKYYTLTVNKRGKLKAKRINLETVEPEKIMASN